MSGLCCVSTVGYVLSALRLTQAADESRAVQSVQQLAIFQATIGARAGARSGKSIRAPEARASRGFGSIKPIVEVEPGCTRGLSESGLSEPGLSESELANAPQMRMSQASTARVLAIDRCRLDRHSTVTGNGSPWQRASAGCVSLQPSKRMRTISSCPATGLNSRRSTLPEYVRSNVACGGRPYSCE